MIPSLLLPMCGRPLVLVADDSVLVRWAVGHALNEAGFDVMEAGTRRQALEALVAGSFPLVIMSLSLESEDMEDIACAYAAPAAHSALILLTENNNLPDALRREARVKVLEKPFCVADLVTAALGFVRLGNEPSQKSISV